jgi:hypothetical protein
LKTSEPHICAPPQELKVNLPKFRKLFCIAILPAALTVTGRLNAQNLTLEGQTGGFLTPTAYVVESAKGHFFSMPALGYHFIDAKSVIGDIQTVSITEGFANRAEVGYTRSIHTMGDATNPAQGDFSSLWNFSGMNVFHGKVVGIRDGQFGPWTPGIALGGVVRTNDKFVSGAAAQEGVELYDSLGGALPVPAATSYTNGDVYLAVTKTWAKPPVPFLLNLGWKATNASIFGIGGQANGFHGRFFGGLGIPLPLGHGIVAVPSAGFTQEPRTVKNLGTNPPYGIPLIAGKADLPTTLDYAVRVTQREHPRFSFDIGVGQVANNIGAVPVVVGGTVVGALPVNLDARHVIGVGLSIRP